MYPSGTWRGYWDQAGYGRQSMNDLVLRFAAGEIEGVGVDLIGPFEFAGTYAKHGGVTLVKYYDRHEVLYQGAYDGEGTIFGTWNIGDLWRGNFALTPNRSTFTPDAEIQEVLPNPRKH